MQAGSIRGGSLVEPPMQGKQPFTGEDEVEKIQKLSERPSPRGRKARRLAGIEGSV